MLSSVDDWTLAIISADYDKTKRLLGLEPQLLWTPLTHFSDDHLQTRLVQLGYLGTDFRPFYGLHLAMFSKNIEFILFLLKRSISHDLNTKFWGQCNNTTLHLACFLDQQTIVDRLLEKGVTQRINSLGYLPSDINLTIQLDHKQFILGSLNQKKTEHQYFRKGKVLETQLKLNEEEDHIIEQRRKKEVAQLASRSAVKSNPLYQQFEKITLKTYSEDDESSSEEEVAPCYEVESDEEEGLQKQAVLLKPIYRSALLSEETMIEDQREMKRRSGSQKAAWTMSISSWAAILDREFNLNDLNPTLSPIKDDLVKEREDLPVRSDSIIPPLRRVVMPDYKGKFRLRIHSIQDILLPMPKDRSFVRCVVSDGRFEYMSRYEVLSQNIKFDYECLIDTHPDMIITLSLHVRPDYIMKSRKPFSRLFTSRKKKKESLSSYVNKEDGAIGQARFALNHMLPACNETEYDTGLSCFNSWYSKSFKEKRRQKKKNQDVLKVVANFDTSMIYLPHQDEYLLS
ncbi:hypothetical protein G6F56_005845 [Rhizopus delemar]|nr:hypothetical protein G6F56_005845 [Rhizopus delemar]